MMRSLKSTRRILDVILEQCFGSEADLGEEGDRRLLLGDHLHGHLRQARLEGDTQRRAGETLPDASPPYSGVDHQPHLWDMP